MVLVQAFRYILYLILCGSCVYAVCYYIGVLDIAQLCNSAIVLLASVVALIATIKNKYFADSVPLFLIFICIGNMLISGVIQNSLIEILPTITRYTLYILTANICYFIIKRYGLSVYLHSIKWFTKPAIVLTLFFVVVELLLNDIDYLNGAYRIAGSFKKHQLGEALFVYVLLIIVLFSFRYNIRKCVFISILFGIIIGTQSRALIGIVVFVGLLYIILRIKSFKNLLISLGVLIVLCGSAYYLIMYTDILPRFKSIFVTENGVYDASTLERIEIMENSLSNIHGIHEYIGVGIGGFQKFYQSITGREGVAAHNNYLLFYVEGGYISLIAYILFQISMILSLFKNIRFSSNPIVSIAFFLFMGITVMSFLLNNYYFYCSETLLWSVIGAYLGLINSKSDYYAEENFIFPTK